MSVLLDIFGSTFVAGMLLLLMIKLNLYATNTAINSDTELHLQQNAKTIAEIINYDLRKIGYMHTGTAILEASPQKIRFYADLQPPGVSGHGTMDIVEYHLKDSTKSLSTTNLKDKSLTRVVNGTDTLSGPTLGLVDFRLSYYTGLGAVTSILDSIKYVKAEFWVEPTEVYNNFISGKKDSMFTYWELTINPRNI